VRRALAPKGSSMTTCIDANRASLSRGSRSDSRRQATAAGATFAQELAIFLDGITAGDYLTWVRDPEPHALGRDLIAIAAEADPLADRIEVQLIWDHTPPDLWTAASAAGFAMTPEVVAVLAAGWERSSKPLDRRDDRRSR
jgi:hypothetical protein